MRNLFITIIGIVISFCSNAQSKKIMGSWFVHDKIDNYEMKIDFGEDSFYTQRNLSFPMAGHVDVAKYYMKNDSTLVIIWNNNSTRNAIVKFIGINKMKMSYPDDKEIGLYHIHIFQRWE
jgi:hypothetical protein